MLDDLRDSRPAVDLRVAAGEGQDIRAQVEQSMQAFRRRAALEIEAAKPVDLKTKKEGKGSKDAVEGRLSIDLYELLRELRADVLTDPGFWRYLAVSEMFDFIQWRDGANCKYVSFGAGSQFPTWDCAPKRMFVRAQIMYAAAESERAKQLAAVSGTDLWRSHILRVKTGNAPLLSSALVQAWDTGDVRTKTIRKVATRLRRLRSNVVFELLDEAQIQDALDTQISRVRADEERKQ